MNEWGGKREGAGRKGEYFGLETAVVRVPKAYGELVKALCKAWASGALEPNDPAIYERLRELKRAAIECEPDETSDDFSYLQWVQEEMEAAEIH